MLPINPKLIPQIYSAALKDQSAGRFAPALEKYRQILAANRRIAEVPYQMARIYLRQGQVAEARASCAAALALKPAEAQIWALRMEIEEAAPEDASHAALMREISASPLAGAQKKALIARLNAQKAARGKAQTDLKSLAPETAQKLVALMQAQDYAGAIAMGAPLRKMHPKTALIPNILAGAYSALGQYEAAVAAYEAALSLDRKDRLLWGNYGRSLLSWGEALEALRVFERGMVGFPAAQDLRLGAAEALLALDRAQEALAQAEHVLGQSPRDAEALHLKGRALLQLLDPDAAHAALLSATRIAPTPARQMSLAAALSKLGRDTEAIEIYRLVLDKEPEHVGAWGRLGLAYQVIGDFEAAAAAFQKTIDIEPWNGEHYRVLGASRTFSPDDPLLAQMEALYATPEALKTPRSRMQMGFALSKAMEDIKAHGRVFFYLNAASKLMRKAHPYDIAARRKEIDAIKRIFEGMDLARFEGAGFTQDRTIFVTGMPRSGTTLIEQILASHAQVTGAGEVGALSRAAYQMVFAPKNPLQSWQELAPEALRSLGEGYHTLMRARFEGAEIITDKSIQSYLMAGLLQASLPNARFVLVRRDPRDNLLSIYKNIFPEGTHGYSYDLKDLAQYYVMFDEITRFWQETCPGIFYEASYEALTANPEGEIPGLVQGAGLSWDPACLKFHENKRRVDTLSIYQVRQPIYSSSKAAWKRYEADLAPMIEVLDAAGLLP